MVLYISLLTGILSACVLSRSNSFESRVARLGDNVTLSWQIPEPGLWGYRVEVSSPINGRTAVLDVDEIDNIETFDNEYKDRVVYNGTLSESGAGLFSMVLFNVTERDAGTYESWKNGVQKSNWAQMLVIIAPPSFRNCTIIPNTVRVDETASINCTLYGEPHPLVSLQHGGKVMVMTIHNFTQDNIYYSYVINNVRCSDHGRYDINASNTVGTQHHPYLNLSVICTEPVQSGILPGAVVCTMVLTVAAFVAVFMCRHKRKQHRIKRNVTYRSPSGSDASNYATIHLEDISVDSASATKNHYQHFHPRAHHHIYTALYATAESGGEQHRCSTSC